MCVCTDDNVVNGTFLEVTKTTVPVCVSFGCINDNSEMVVLAHHIGDDDGDGDDDSEKLSAYYLSSTNSCFTGLPTGSYIIGVFIRMEANTLVAPTTVPTISERFSASPNPAFCPPGKYYYIQLALQNSQLLYCRCSRFRMLNLTPKGPKPVVMR